MTSKLLELYASASQGVVPKAASVFGKSFLKEDGMFGDCTPGDWAEGMRSHSSNPSAFQDPPHAGLSGEPSTPYTLRRRTHREESGFLQTASRHHQTDVAPAGEIGETVEH